MKYNKIMASDMAHNLHIIRDPIISKNRIFIGNLPECTSGELSSICQPYGKVIASLSQKNFGFVQFESEEIANKAAAALNKSIFKGNSLTVRNAGIKPMGPKKMGISAAVAARLKSADYNDCEIIVVDRKNTEYAEVIEARLKSLNLRVDVLFPNEDVPLGKVLSNISSRDCLYAVLVTNEHEELKSITVNVLYGQPAEHRNMPLEDAIRFISEDFNRKMAQEAIKNASQHQQTNISSLNIPTYSNKDAGQSTIKNLLGMAFNDVNLTVMQCNLLIKYFEDCRDKQLKVELGDAANSFNRELDPEIELAKKMQNVLNKPSVADMKCSLLYPNLSKVKEDHRLMELLKDSRVQKSLESMMNNQQVVNKGKEILKAMSK